jgi:hypothetical protein
LKKETTTEQRRWRRWRLRRDFYYSLQPTERVELAGVFDEHQMAERKVLGVGRIVGDRQSLIQEPAIFRHMALDISAVDANLISLVLLISLPNGP